MSGVFGKNGSEQWASNSLVVVILRHVLRTLLSVTVYGLLLFVPAMTVQWPRAWLLLGMIFAGMLLTWWWVFRNNDALLLERRKSPFAHGQPKADKVLVIAFLIVMPGYIVAIPIDVFHLHVFGLPGAGVADLGLLGVISGWLLVTLAFRVNVFALSIVKDQSERGQRVVDQGVYGFVRHPMYLGVALTLIGIALWLESTVTVLLAAFPLGVIVARIIVEERFLRERLPGYTAYSVRVRHRFIPMIW